MLTNETVDVIYVDFHEDEKSVQEPMDIINVDSTVEYPSHPFSGCGELIVVGQTTGKELKNDVLFSPCQEEGLDSAHTMIEFTDDMIPVESGHEISVETTDEVLLTHDCIEKEIEKFSGGASSCYSDTLDSIPEALSIQEYHADETEMASRSLSSYLNGSCEEIRESGRVTTRCNDREYHQPETEVRHYITDKEKEAQMEAEEKRKIKNRQHAKNSRARIKANREEIEKVYERLHRWNSKLQDFISKGEKYYKELSDWLQRHSTKESRRTCAMLVKQTESKRQTFKMPPIPEQRQQSKSKLSSSKRNHGPVAICKRHEAFNSLKDEKTLSPITVPDKKGKEKSTFKMKSQKKSGHSYYSPRDVTQSPIRIVGINNSNATKIPVTNNSIKASQNLHHGNTCNATSRLGYNLWDSKNNYPCVQGRKMHPISSAFASSLCKPKISKLDFKMPKTNLSF